jgi:hypothetical protein
MLFFRDLKLIYINVVNTYAIIRYRIIRLTYIYIIRAANTYSCLLYSRPGDADYSYRDIEILVLGNIKPHVPQLVQAHKTWRGPAKKSKPDVTGLAEKNFISDALKLHRYITDLLRVRIVLHVVHTL